MLWILALVLTVVYSAEKVHGFPRFAGTSSPPASSAGGATPSSQSAPQLASSRPLVYVPSARQQYLQYDFPLYDPQFYNFDKRPLEPRVQHQILLYGPGGPGGQPFLLQPGSPSPGNFLVPQPHHPGPGPNVILRDSPQRPIFIAGYPKPAHIPPIEKDAEEIPTNPSQIPPFTPKGSNSPGGRKPEKLETFNESDDNKSATEAEVLAAADRNPFLNSRIPNLHPGQRFFILNGQPLFSNYPYHQSYPSYQNPNVIKYAQGSPDGNFLVRNPVTGQIDDVNPEGRDNPDNIVLLNQPEDFQNHQSFRANLQLEPATKDAIRIENNGEPENVDQTYKFQTSDDDVDDSVIIDAREQDEPLSESATQSSTDEEVQPPEKIPEPTISQAQPGAIALAGPGGVASAAPRGTAFVGKQGVAVASPQATAVAGPSKDKKKENKKDPKKE